MDLIVKYDRKHNSFEFHKIVTTSFLTAAEKIYRTYFAIITELWDYFYDYYNRKYANAHIFGGCLDDRKC